MSPSQLCQYPLPENPHGICGQELPASDRGQLCELHKEAARKQYLRLRNPHYVHVKRVKDSIDKILTGPYFITTCCHLVLSRSDVREILHEVHRLPGLGKVFETVFDERGRLVQPGVYFLKPVIVPINESYSYQYQFDLIFVFSKSREKHLFNFNLLTYDNRHSPDLFAKTLKDAFSGVHIREDKDITVRRLTDTGKNEEVPSKDDLERTLRYGHFLDEREVLRHLRQLAVLYVVDHIKLVFEDFGNLQDWLGRKATYIAGPELLRVNRFLWPHCPY